MSCRLCGGVGMVRNDDFESGGWETCPVCYPPKEREPMLLYRLWRWFLARFRLSNEAVCEMSRGPVDYHDYPDAGNPPWHDHVHKCLRCGKEFTI